MTFLLMRHGTLESFGAYVSPLKLVAVDATPDPNADPAPPEVLLSLMQESIISIKSIQLFIKDKLTFLKNKLIFIHRC